MPEKGKDNQGSAQGNQPAQSGVPPQWLAYMPAFVTPRKKGKARTILSIVWTVIILGALFILLKPMIFRQPLDPVYDRIEGIKRIRELRLVRHHYESIIPITKENKDKLEFLMIAPIEISGVVDLGLVRIEVLPDSLVLIDLPNPTMTEPFLDLQQTREYTYRRRSLFPGKNKYEDAYVQIAESISRAKDDVRVKAERNGLLLDTRIKAEDYLRNIIISLGYRVQFTEASMDTTGLSRMRGKLNLEASLDEIINLKDKDEKEKKKNELLKRMGFVMKYLP